jgi:hypothetical protein
MNDYGNTYEWQHKTYTSLFGVSGYIHDTMSALTTEELIAMMELFYEPHIDSKTDTMLPKKKSINHKFSMTK